MSKTKKASKTIRQDIIKKINENPKKFAEETDIKNLVKILRTLSNVYYNTGQSSVSDEVYDVLRDILEKRDPNNAFLLEIGAPVEKNRVELPFPMGSLTKIKPEKENLDAWLKKYPSNNYVLSDKLDGVSAQYYKESHDKFKLFSRGDGIYGTDISHLIKFVIPNTVNNDIIPVGTSIRGEIIISKEDFKQISNIMKNARNAVAGLVNSKTIDKNLVKICQFIAYAIINPSYKQEEQMKLLQDYGFKVVNYKIVKQLNYKMLSDYLIDRRQNSEFEIDGLVVIDNSKAYPHKAGNPDHAFAFKQVLQDQISETTILNIEWNITMDGYLKPTIIVKPIELGGTTVTRATAFNAKFVADNKLGPGAIVKIIRSGDVIPYIMEIVKPAKEPQLPDLPYIWTDTGVDIVLKDLYGAQADAIAIRLITHFFNTLGVEFISEGIVTKLVNSGYKTIPDVINALKNKQDALADIEGIGTKIIEKIWESFKSALKSTDLATFMASSHVFGRGFGRRKIKEIINVYPDIMSQKWDKKTMTDKIQQIKGFSTTTAKQFADNFKDFEKFYQQINKIIDISHLLKTKKIKENEQLTFQDMTFVFTGFRDKELENKIISLGGRVSSSVSRKTSLVIQADDNIRTSKITEAEKLNVPILTKSEFIKKYKLK